MHQSKFKLNKWMVFAGWAILLGCLYLLFDGLLKFQNNPNQNLQAQWINGHQEVMLQANHQHQYVFNGQINNYPVTFLVDTGATTITIPLDMRKRLGLPQGMQGFASTANGTVTIYDTHIQSLKIGSIELTHLDGALTKGLNGQNQVLLGMNALKQLHASFQNGTLILKQYR